MKNRAEKPWLSLAAIAAARPRAKSGAGHFTIPGCGSIPRAQGPSSCRPACGAGSSMARVWGVSIHVPTRVRGRKRKITLGRFPDIGSIEARKEAAAVLACIWSGEHVAPARRVKAPVFRDFAARYRGNRKDIWEPSSLKTFDIYVRGRLLPAFGRLELDTIDHARVSAWFDAASEEQPGAANRALDILRAMLKTAQQWGGLGEHVPDACTNIAANAKKPVARYPGEKEFERLGSVLDRHSLDHPWLGAALRLLALTGAWLLVGGKAPLTVGLPPSRRQT